MINKYVAFGLISSGNFTKDCDIKANEILGFLPFMNNSVTIAYVSAIISSFFCWIIVF